ncbi:carbohydrate-binding module family 67 protein [Hypholoma sublateritium FD-334 SS-4]|uniref:Carbohydrate-binding module family 67 protein n=1 Tax=Hypholoma sublateritium (strain FD-334 SS-4) TaxID=945553 RepID=A0A0D2KHJ8_HYPSF|nr:carbohydrate-binding module family 67 protein [Hypholoma sublateritium FD-334 SS-4]
MFGTGHNLFSTDDIVSQLVLSFHDSTESLDISNHPTPWLSTCDKIMTWIRRQEKPESETSLMWLDGDAGAGKTIIAHALARHCQAENILAASFFSVFWMTGLSMHSVEEQLKSLIIKPLKQFRATHTDALPSYAIVINALDESSGNPRDLSITPPLPDLTFGSWIWTWEKPYSDPPVGPRLFQKAVIIPEGRFVDSLAINIACDDTFALYVNGKLLGSGKQWTTGHRWSITFPLTNKLIVAVYATNDPVNRSWTGLIASAVLWDSNTYNGKMYYTVKTDDAWKYLNTVPPHGFERISLDDSSWSLARSEGEYGAQPWESKVKIPQEWVLFLDNHAKLPGPPLSTAGKTDSPPPPLHPPHAASKPPAIGCTSRCTTRIMLFVLARSFQIPKLSSANPTQTGPTGSSCISAGALECLPPALSHDMAFSLLYQCPASGRHKCCGTMEEDLDKANHHDIGGRADRFVMYNVHQR